MFKLTASDTGWSVQQLSKSIFHGHSRQSFFFYRDRVCTYGLNGLYTYSREVVYFDEYLNEWQIYPVIGFPEDILNCANSWYSPKRLLWKVSRVRLGGTRLYRGLRLPEITASVTILTTSYARCTHRLICTCAPRSRFITASRGMANRTRNFYSRWRRMKTAGCVWYRTMPKWPGCASYSTPTFNAVSAILAGGEHPARIPPEYWRPAPLDCGRCAHFPPAKTNRSRLDNLKNY